MSPDEMYTNFKEELQEKARNLPADVIDCLLKIYEPVIKSKRRSSCIRSCADLISVLEKRDCVKPQDFSKLTSIVERLPNFEDRDRMLAFLREVPPTFYPPNRLPAKNPERIMSHHSPSQSIPITRETPNILPSRVIDCIAREIGKKWRDLSRKLKLREGELDRIEKQHPQDWRLCAYESLLLYQEKCTSKREMEENLLRALEKARRQDLHNEVQILLSSDTR